MLREFEATQRYLGKRDCVSCMIEMWILGIGINSSVFTTKDIELGKEHSQLPGVHKGYDKYHIPGMNSHK